MINKLKALISPPSLRLKNVGVGGGSSGSTNNNIDVYNINTYYVLGIIDALLFLWAVFQLIRIRIYSRNGAKNLKPKLIFHSIIAITMLVRSGFFFASQEINNFDTVVIWYEVSSMLLFAGYGCLLLFWMELYSRFSKPYTTAKDFWNIWRPRIIIFATLIILSLVAWIIVLTVWADTEDKKVLLDQIVEGIISGLFLIAGFGFLLYGILLFLSFKKLDRLSTSVVGNSSSSSSSSNGISNSSNVNNNNSNGAGSSPIIIINNSSTSSITSSSGISSNGGSGGGGDKQHFISNSSSNNRRRRSLLQSPPEAIRAAVVGSICTVCFCIRSVITLYSIRESISDPNQSGTTSFNLGWEFELAYFFITEILPTMLMMFRLRKMKKKKQPLLSSSSNSITINEGVSGINQQKYSLLTSASFNQLVKSTQINNHQSSNNNNNNNNVNSPLIFKHNDQQQNSQQPYNYSSDESSSDYDSDEESSSSSNHHHHHHHQHQHHHHHNNNYQHNTQPSYRATILPQ